MLGEVTPQGVVHLTMYNVSDGSIINQPMGNMVQVNGQWTMVNTMTAPATGGGSVSHWAYMVLSKPEIQAGIIFHLLMNRFLPLLLTVLLDQ